MDTALGYILYIQPKFTEQLTTSHFSSPLLPPRLNPHNLSPRSLQLPPHQPPTQTILATLGSMTSSRVTATVLSLRACSPSAHWGMGSPSDPPLHLLWSLCHHATSSKSLPLVLQYGSCHLPSLLILPPKPHVLAPNLASC